MLYMQTYSNLHGSYVLEGLVQVEIFGSQNWVCILSFMYEYAGESSWNPDSTILESDQL